jgi:hypothetical protein
MAKAASAAGDKKGKTKKFKKKERKHVPHGLVHVQASFNNTIVTISDRTGIRCRGKVRDRWASADRARERRSPRSRPQ